MKKKNFKQTFNLVILFITFGCNYLPNSDSILGALATSQLQTAASSMTSLKIFIRPIFPSSCSSSATSSITSSSFSSTLYSSILKNIPKLDKTKYYLKESVDECKTKIKMFSIILPLLASDAATRCDVEAARTFTNLSGELVGRLQCKIEEAHFIQLGGVGVP